MTDKEREYADLKRKRATIKSQITKFSTFLDGFIVNKAALTQLRIRLEKIEQSWMGYSNIQDQIKALDSTEAFTCKQQQERSEFEEAYFSIVGRAHLILEENTNQRVNMEVENAAVGIVSENAIGTSVKLPVLNLQTFEGTYEQWPMFFSTFSALVDKNANLNNVHKFYYLQSALGPKPRKIIESLDLTEESYPRAIELLKGRFDKTRLATRHHARAIFDLKPIIEESYDLRNLTDNLKQHLETLKALKYKIDTWCPLIIEWILTRVDPITAREWEDKTAPNPEYKTKEFIQFLEAKCNMLENVSALDNTKLDSEKSKRCKDVAHVTKESRLKCPICKGEHKTYQCETFKGLNVKSRLAEVHKARLCLNCLHPNHIVRDCRSNACKQCNKKHHSLLHYQNSDNESKNEVKTEVEVFKISSIANSIVTCVPTCTNSEILLSTACVQIVDKNGKWHEARALLDNAATINFITSDLLHKLDLQTERVAGQVIGFSGNATRTKEIVTTTIKSKVQQYSQSLKCTVVDQITSKIPESRIDISRLKLPDSISISQLADPMFNVPQEIDLLLGATVFWNVLQRERIQLNNEQSVFQNTKLGWILGGSFTPSQVSATKICCLVTNDNLSKQLERFWELEKCDLHRTLTIEEAKCEKHFESTTNRDRDGRFVVSLPLKGKIQDLGESEHNAMKRQKSIERRFTKNSVFQQRYVDFMREYQRMEHMELVPENGNHGVVNYLPHHAVTREESTTTKLRVVFDASCKTSSGQSLNDLLMVGPKIQQELMEILIRFQQHNYVLIANISKMFRQIKINKRDRALQRILWRDDPRDTILKFELTTITYGTASAPYLAQRCLKQLALDNSQTYPGAAATIQNDFYMDDLITGSDSVSHLQQLKQEIVKILATAGLELRKWNSNVLELLSNSENERPLASKEEVKTLGIHWNAQEDMFKFKVTIPREACKSKRGILSVIAQIYDPLGLIGPVMVKAKLFIRSLWKLSVNWDDKLPSEFMFE
ncbi:PREDICTED: uncharacterized protein LOC108761581 [Trachymyrmex cornetzi]|uniref:uncharacterized protein LOC108761581 n=1 Tax=Trachymyrmex cornetzi TaxID=471704 RepID=UPI00084EFB81|nr:PREDICTED: uncharacterized protein LOC108761581 [Trachymyrmex cornetzi]